MYPTLLALGGLLGVLVEARSPFDLPESEWNALNATVGGRLARGVPVARACFQKAGTNVSDAPWGMDCGTVQSNYGNSSWRSGSYSARMGLQWESCQKTNKGCSLDPKDPKNASAFSTPRICDQGSVSPYYIAVKSAADVTQGFAFSNRTGVPLSIKNTGHDGAGRSTAPGTLAFWTNDIKYINYSTTFVPEGCTQVGVPALTYGAGQDMGSLYGFAESNNITFIGASARTVGAAGGWLQGGGHSILSNTYGLGVDRVLQFRVVTPDGRARVANVCQNQDLFWALRGGGGGTFGVVLEATSEVVPNPVSTVALSWQLNPTPDNIKSFFTILVQNSIRWSQEGWGGSFNPSGSIIANPRMNASQAAESLTPLTDFLKNASNGNASQVQWSQHSSVLQLLSPSLAGADALPLGKFAMASRLIPRSAFTQSNSAALLEAMLRTWSTADNVWILMTTPFSYQVPEYARGKTSVTPAWRGAVWHVIASTSWAWDSGAKEAKDAYLKASSAIEPMRAITPGSGAYQNEADVYEPEASISFWGSNYPALSAIKENYDPDALLDCWHCVGWKGRSTPIASCYV
ncbi:FAD-binding domain-containing protein [Rhizoctonia solani]|nr:FAD-binding domain-containing protein [Rhizoctonia solani]